jgi:phospholipid/cholesterol/gamma-HCH transport system substrate-binding protein
MQTEFPSILHQINNMTLQYGELGSKLNQLDLAETKARLDHTIEGLDHLTIQLNSSDNSLGLLLHDTTLYVHLNQTVSSANNLLIDLKEHPKRYVHFSLIGPTNKP